MRRKLYLFMSVLKNKRSQSKALFVNISNNIYMETLSFLSRLSSRYSRLIAQTSMNLAAEVAENCEKGNAIFPSDDLCKRLRRIHFLKAKAALSSLDCQMTRIYDILAKNPAKSFGDELKNDVPEDKIAKKAIEKLDNMASSLGEKIDVLKNLLDQVMKSDKDRATTKSK